MKECNSFKSILITLTKEGFLMPEFPLIIWENTKEYEVMLKKAEKKRKELVSAWC